MNSEFSSIHVVLVGNFHPNTFRPDNLVKEKLVSAKSANSISVIGLIPETQIELTLGWGTLKVFRNRFEILTSELPYVRAADFAIKAISDLDTQSNITAFGINRTSHFNFGSIAKRNEFGVRLAPPTAWGSWGQRVLESMDTPEANSEQSNNASRPPQGGVLTIQMRLNFSEKPFAGWRDIRVTPSGLIENHAGVQFYANHHHQAYGTLASMPVGEGVEDLKPQVLECFPDRFESSIAESDSIFSEAAGA